MSRSSLVNACKSGTNACKHKNNEFGATERAGVRNHIMRPLTCKPLSLSLETPKTFDNALSRSGELRVKWRECRVE